MQGSKIDLTQRLRKEDRWEEASKFKDEQIAMLRAEGKNRKEARQAAWEAMEQRFPPLEVEPVVGEEGAYPTDLIEVGAIGSSDFHGDADWVYQHIAVAVVKPEDAPTPGAWALFKWAKRNEDRFFEHVMPKAIASNKSPDPFSDEGDQADPSIGELQNMLDELFASWEEHAVENVAHVVKNEVSKKIAEWRSRSGLSLSTESTDCLTWQMIALVDDLIHAALDNPEAFRNRPRSKARP
jgi:hypothetical protein